MSSSALVLRQPMSDWGCDGCRGAAPCDELTLINVEAFLMEKSAVTSLRFFSQHVCIHCWHCFPNAVAVYPFPRMCSL